MKEQRIKKRVTVHQTWRFHAGPSALFVKLANRFDSEVLVEKDGETVNGKSIMGLHRLGIGPRSHITILAIGSDANEAAEALSKVISHSYRRVNVWSELIRSKPRTNKS